MTLRPPRTSSSARPTGIAALDYEIAQEQASALGRLGRALERALAALADCDATDGAASPLRAQLLQEASEALWCFVVQREACGLRDPRPVIRDYGVPPAVYARMGVRPTSAPAGEPRRAAASGRRAATQQSEQ